MKTLQTAGGGLLPINEPSLEQLEIAFVLYVAGKVGADSSMTVDDIRTCVETLQRLGQRYVERALGRRDTALDS